MQGSSLWLLRNCDLELVLCIVPLLPPLFVTALTVCTSTAALRLSVPNVSRGAAACLLPPQVGFLMSQ